MGVNLGSEFLPTEDLAQKAPDPSITLLEEIRAALVAMPQLVASAAHYEPPVIPAPYVHVAEPDLSAIVTAVNGLKPGADTRDLARMIAEQLNPQAQGESSMMVEAMRELVDKIDFRLQGVGRAFGSSGPSNISDNAQRQLGIVTIGSMPAPGAVDGLDFAGQALPYTTTTGVLGPFLLGRLELIFTGATSRTIKLTTTDGTILVNDTCTNLSWVADFDELPFPNGDQLTLAITGGSGSVTGSMTVLQGVTQPLSGTTTPVSQNGAWTVAVSGTTAVRGGSVVDPNNTTTTPLAANGVFTGATTDLSNYSSITYNLYADPDQMATPPVLSFQFSPDGVNWDVQVPSTIANGHIFIPVPLRPVERYFRIIYTNGSANQNTFRLTTYLHNEIVEQLARTGTQTIQPNDPTTVVRALIEPGFRGHLSLLGADRSIGAEGIVLPYIVIDRAQFDVPFASSALTATTSGVGTATQTAAAGAVLAVTSAASAGSANLQGSKRLHYIPGRESRCEFSAAYPAAGLSNCDVVVGLSDQPATPLSGTANSLLLGYVNTVFGLHIVSGGAVTSIPKTAWNGDTLDGSGLSGFRTSNIPQALDITKANAWRIRYVYYGVGPVFLDVKSPDDGIWVTAHQLHYPNTATVPYIQSPNLFLCWDVTKGAVAGALSLSSFSANSGVVTAEDSFLRHEVSGHVLLNIASSGLAVAAGTPQNIYTVPTGRQALISSIPYTASIAQANAVLEFHDDTGSGTGTLKYALGGGQANTLSQLPGSFEDPLQFLNGITLKSTSGTITVSGAVTGLHKEL